MSSCTWENTVRPVPGAKVTTLLSTAYEWALGDRSNLEVYWEMMHCHLDDPPDRSFWGVTIPYCLWGDEGTLPNSASWMFGTMSLT